MILSILFSVLLSIFLALLALSLLILVHELGHFYVARLFGIAIVRFSIGFGPVLLRWKDRQGTEFTLCAILLGGYVRFTEPYEARDPRARRIYANQPIPARLAVVLAGPFANLLLAYVFFVFLGLYGIEGVKPVIDKVRPASPAALAKLQPGDKVLAVNHRKVHTWKEMGLQLVTQLGKNAVPLQVEDDQKTARTLPMDLEKFGLNNLEDRSLYDLLGMSLRLPETPAIIGRVIENSPAAAAGLRAKDQVLSVNGLPIESWSQWSAVIHQSPNKQLALEVLRGGKEILLSITPKQLSDEREIEYGFAGIAPAQVKLSEEYLSIHSYSLSGVWYPALLSCYQSLTLVMISLRDLLLGELSVKHLSGPVSIVKYIGDSARYGIETFVRILAFISLSLFVFNLLPLPVLDGGHITLYIAEGIRKKPLSPKFQAYYFKTGFILLLILLIFVTLNDLSRLL